MDRQRSAEINQEDFVLKHPMHAALYHCPGPNGWLALGLPRGSEGASKNFPGKGVVDWIQGRFLSKGLRVVVDTHAVRQISQGVRGRLGVEDQVKVVG